MKNGKKQLVIALAAAGVGITSVPVVQAQQGVLEEITVTARKREESMQDVGISVSALSETEIQRQFARDIQDLANISPNLIIDDTGQGPGGTARTPPCAALVSEDKSSIGLTPLCAVLFSEN